MKRLGVLILSLVFSYCWKGTAQDPLLIDNPWYLEKLIIEGEEIIPPYLEIEPVVGRIFFQIESVTVRFCDFRIWDVVYDSGENSFVFGNWIAAGQGCDQPGNFLFEPVYTSIFYEGEITKNPFTYDIISGNGDVLSLTITNVEGDQAIYGNVFLSVPEARQSAIDIYPNPAKSIIYINATAVHITSLKLYTITGLRVTNVMDDLESVDISGLAAGMYLLKISTENGSVVKKLVKK